MTQEFKKNAVIIEKIYHCPHHPDISGKCTCRKPHDGMLQNAKEEFDIDLDNSIIIGDKERDIEAGLNAGLSETYLFDESQTIKKSKATKIVSNLKDIYNVNT